MSILPVQPELKETLWGGTWFWRQGLHQEGRRRIGEMWYTVPGMPLMVKFIDAAAPLSLQVHPGDAQAWQSEGKRGKTEAWYIWSTEPGAYIYYGFQRPVEKKEVEAAIRAGQLEKLVKKVKVRAGDMIFVPPGTIHAIGAGVRLVEVQTAVDLTYRLYDWGRGRKLQIEKGLALLNTAAVEENIVVSTLERQLTELHCPAFRLQKLNLQGQMQLSPGGSWFFLVGLKGEGQLSSGRWLYQVKPGTVYWLDSTPVWLGGKIEVLILNGNI
ncbi:mannose-6-phosphate isomerase, type 1 [Carboxydocella thermautotrophica]|nr:mannose-6-phosphate isomerase, type 1 [Carboxydocella thermautotrophica]